MHAPCRNLWWIRGRELTPRGAINYVTQLLRPTQFCIYQLDVLRVSASHGSCVRINIWLKSNDDRSIIRVSRLIEIVHVFMRINLISLRVIRHLNATRWKWCLKTDRWDRIRSKIANTDITNDRADTTIIPHIFIVHIFFDVKLPICLIFSE